ncbi:hypothetical protein [Microbacterium sp. S1037]|uniref:hypothetical protein n=1 Tax=Microbacterium sp. S1037 TaxID=3398227 RepID=UPI003AAF3041
MGGSIERITLTVDGSSYALGPLESLDDLREQILRAAHAAGGFLNVTADGGQRFIFFVTAATSIVISIATVPLEGPAADQDPTGWRSSIPPDYEDDDIPFDTI